MGTSPPSLRASWKRPRFLVLWLALGRSFMFLSFNKEIGTNLHFVRCTFIFLCVELYSLPHFKAQCSSQDAVAKVTRQSSSSPQIPVHYLTCTPRWWEKAWLCEWLLVQPRKTQPPPPRRATRSHNAYFFQSCDANNNAFRSTSRDVLCTTYCCCLKLLNILC